MSEITELTSEEQWRDALPVLCELRPDLEIAETLNARESLLTRGYKLYGLVQNGRFVCVASVVLHPHITRGNDFWVHDLATLPEVRSQGHGETMMRFLEGEAQALGCSRLFVHTRLIRDRAQNFYETHLSYERYAVVFQKDFK
jgi:ribosomal protein S18 acetylase RimI-like enzyme